MKFSINQHPYEKSPADCLILGIFEDGQLSDTAHQIDKKCKGFLTQILVKDRDFQARIGQTLLLVNVPHLAVKKILLVGCGPNKKPLNGRDFRKVNFWAIRALCTTQIKQVINSLIDLPVEKMDLSIEKQNQKHSRDRNNEMTWKIKQAVESCYEGIYYFEDYKSKKEPLALTHCIFSISENDAKAHSRQDDNAHLKSYKNAIHEAICVAEAVKLTKDLANTPSNVCTPSYMLKQAQKLAADYKRISLSVVDKKEMKKLGMNAFLSVAQGSAEEPKLIILQYKGGQDKQGPHYASAALTESATSKKKSLKKTRGKHTRPTLALIGKGITFDTGGVSIKPADAMVGMKYDMCGAATVLGVIKAVADLKLPVNVVGLLACAENMPSGTAYKPEDIVKSLSGQTIEVLNTDAEGRLVLCDTLTYAERFQPDEVIDIATLTGAVVIALGNHATGLLSNNETLAQNLLTAGIESQDRAWQLPLWDEYQEQLKSPFADMSNIGGRSAGTITAACFLSRFAKKFAWAHLDVAGTAALMGGGMERFATGRPVPMLVQYLINKCQ